MMKVCKTLITKTIINNNCRKNFLRYPNGANLYFKRTFI